jgi:hypothetical protein
MLRAKLICGGQNYRRQKDNAPAAFASTAITGISPRREYPDWRNQSRRQKRRPKIRNDAREETVSRCALIK